MEEKIKLALKNFYHDMSISELHLQNQHNPDGKLTYNDILYLSIIQAHSGEYTASQIADMLYVSRPAVTQKINDLEKRGFIYKKQSETDKRVYKLSISKTGFANTYNDLLEESDATTASLLCKKYTADDLNLFCEMLETMRTVFIDDLQKSKNSRKEEQK